jgi:hypothetical protein
VPIEKAAANGGFLVSLLARNIRIRPLWKRFGSRRIATDDAASDGSAVGELGDQAFAGPPDRKEFQVHNFNKP